MGGTCKNTLVSTGLHFVLTKSVTSLLGKCMLQKITQNLVLCLPLQAVNYWRKEATDTFCINILLLNVFYRTDILKFCYTAFLASTLKKSDSYLKQKIMMNLILHKLSADEQLTALL